MTRPLFSNGSRWNMVAVALMANSSRADHSSRAETGITWNAAGVCKLRLGNVEAAIETFRKLVVAGSIHLRDDIPPAFTLNFAAALLAAGNIDGFLSALAEVGDRHPTAGRYREAYRRWRASLSPWQKLRMALGGRPSREFAVDFPLGEV